MFCKGWNGVFGGFKRTWTLFCIRMDNCLFCVSCVRYSLVFWKHLETRTTFPIHIKRITIILKPVFESKSVILKTGIFLSKFDYYLSVCMFSYLSNSKIICLSET